MVGPVPEPMADSDIVDRFVELLRAWSPAAAEVIGDKGLRDIGEQLRHEFAGEEVYIARVSRGKRQAVLEQVEKMLHERANVTEIARKTGLSRREVYRKKQKYEAGVGRLRRLSGK